MALPLNLQPQIKTSIICSHINITTNYQWSIAAMDPPHPPLQFDKRLILYWETVRWWSLPDGMPALSDCLPDKQYQAQMGCGTIPGICGRP